MSRFLRVIGKFKRTCRLDSTFGLSTVQNFLRSIFSTNHYTIYILFRPLFLHLGFEIHNISK
jgi:hypothetical protein